MTRSPMFTAQQDQQIADAYREGRTIRQLAAQYGCSVIPIRAALTRQDVPRRSSRDRAQARRTWTTEEEERYLALYRGGMSVAALARHLKVRTDAVSELLARRGEPLHPGGRAHPKLASAEVRQDIVRKYRDGATLRELASQHGCATPAVAKALRAEGVALRSGRPPVWSEERLAQLRDLRSRGMSHPDIASKLGASEAAVKRHLKALGLAKPRPNRSGPAHQSWKGGRHVTASGYVLARPEPGEMEYCAITDGGYAPEHRLVMGRALGRPLLASETVHHINGDRADNRLENLQLRQGKHGKGVAMECLDCGSHNVAAVPLHAPPSGG